MHRTAGPLLIALLVGLAACSEATNGTGMISQRIGELAHDPGARELDLAKLTSFGWDRFYFFKPGTSREDICKFIGANRSNCGRIIRYTTVPYEALEGADALFVVTEWNEFRHPDFERMKALMKTPVIFDGRNIYDPSRMKELGFTYMGLGRR